MEMTSWKHTTLGEVITFQRGYDLPSRDRKPGNIPIITSSGFAGTHKEARVRGPGVVTGRYGTIGEVFYINEDYWPHNTTLYVKDFKGNNPLFVSYLLRTIALQSFSGKSGVPGVNRNDLHEIVLKIPYPTEQVAIATVLNDVDTLLTALDALIAKNRAIKQGVMHELLSGETRLPDFRDKWDTTSLKNVAEIQAGINKPISEMGMGTLYVTVLDLYEGTSIDVCKLGRIRLSVMEIQAKSLLPGDIVFGKSSVKRDGIGYPNQFLGCAEPVVFSGFTFRARARHGITNPSFLFQFLRWEKTRHWLIDNSQSSALTNINQSIADNIPVYLPTLAEQIEIAAFLSDMDAEISELEQQREKTRLLKQGMMQELLTGRIRLL